MSKRELPSPELLRQLLRYEPETGKLFWLPRPAEMFPDERAAKAWNTQNAGKQAFVWANPKGYMKSAVFGQKLYGHRAAFAIMTGAWPVEEIDHINGNRSDNRWENLRPASRAQNCANSGKMRPGTSVFRGVIWNKNEQKWQSDIMVNGEKFYLGRFDCEIEAAKAYDAVAIARRGEFARPNFPPVDNPTEA